MQVQNALPPLQPLYGPVPGGHCLQLRANGGHVSPKGTAVQVSSNVLPVVGSILKHDALRRWSFVGTMPAKMGIADTWRRMDPDCFGSLICVSS
jgi:hypothetical protein